MAKEYSIQGINYTFSKEKFQKAVSKYIDAKRKNVKKYSNSNFYYDLSEAINVSNESVRKWYSMGGQSPSDITLVESIAEYMNLDEVTDLLEKKENTIMLNQSLDNKYDNDRNLVKSIHKELLSFADRLANKEFDDDSGDLSIRNDNVMDALYKIHFMIDCASMDIKSETAHKLHDIVLTLAEDVTRPSVSSKWDALCSDDYYMARQMLVDDYIYDIENEENENYEIDEYLKKIYPYVYDDDDEYYYIPFTTKYFYMREFSISLNNVFRNDFPEYFLFE